MTELSGHMGARGAPVPDLVVDCAGHDAVTEFGPRILRTGIDLIVASLGALAETSVHTRLQAGASSGNARLVLPNGAIGGLDLIRALSQSETPRIVYRGVKPPTEWKGTAAEALVDLDILPEPFLIFEGTALEAALAFPRNINVVATLAMAGPGLDPMRVELIADPHATGNQHFYSMNSSLSRFAIAIAGVGSATYTRASQATALSILD